MKPAHTLYMALRQFGVWMSDEQIALLIKILSDRGFVITEKPRG